MPSVLSHLLVLGLKLTRRRRIFETIDAFHRQIAKERTVPRLAPSGGLRRRFEVTGETIDGATVWTLRPREESLRTPHHVLYLHGGCYVFPITSYHWDFIARLIRATGCAVSVPFYPLAPEHTHRDTHPFVTRVHERILAGAPASSVTVMGDSAGAGLALALTQRCATSGRPLPSHTILLSPWLDVRTNHPDVEGLAPGDPLLAPPGLREGGRLYAGGADLDDPLVSPINGPLSGLGNVALFIGTRDLLLADARELRRRMEGAGAPLGYFEYPDMVHDWMLLPLPEARATLSQLAELIRTPALRPDA